MIRIFRSSDPVVHAEDVLSAGWRLDPSTVWIDLLDPTREEELAVEKALGLAVPTREEMDEIEASSRLYQEDGATFMTAVVLFNSQQETPSAGPITFVLTKGPLVTLRYVEPKSFEIFTQQVERDPSLAATAADAFLNLLEAIVDRTADNLERTSAEVEAISRQVFASRRPRSFEVVLNGLGRNQIVNAKVRDSLLTLGRIISFASLSEPLAAEKESKRHLASLQRDVQSLTDHSSHLSGNIAFLLDAALGLINIEQNAIIKIFSVAAVVFLPPTLIASIYGMNFAHMPELAAPWAYPMVLAAMTASAAAPLVWFRRRGWL
jgi:magnesium transporter